MYSSHRISSETCQKLIFLLTGPRFNPALSVVFFAAVILCAASSEMRATYLFPSFPFPVKLDTFHWGPPGFHDEDTKIPKKWGWNESQKKKTTQQNPGIHRTSCWKSHWWSWVFVGLGTLQCLESCHQTPSVHASTSDGTWWLSHASKTRNQNQWKTTNHWNQPVYISAVLLVTVQVTILYPKYPHLIVG